MFSLTLSNYFGSPSGSWLHINVWSIDSCQNKVSADQYHVTVLRAQASTHQGWVLFEIIRWQVTGFQTIAGSSIFFKNLHEIWNEGMSVYDIWNESYMNCSFTATIIPSFHFIFAVHIWFISYTVISRKVVGKNVHAKIPKGNMGYDQYTVPNDCSCRTYFCCFPLTLANICL